MDIEKIELLEKVDYLKSIVRTLADRQYNFYSRNPGKYVDELQAALKDAISYLEYEFYEGEPPNSSEINEFIAKSRELLNKREF